MAAAAAVAAAAAATAAEAYQNSKFLGYPVWLKDDVDFDGCA